MPTKKQSRGKFVRLNERTVKNLIREEIQDELEEKTALIGGSNTAVQSPSIPSGNVTANSNFPRIFPLITQGVGQYNFRIGNEIRLKHLDIKMLLQYVRPFDELDYTDTTVGVRVMILRQKDSNSDVDTVGNFQGDKLLENGNIVVPGPSDFNGRTINLVQKINRDQFSVRYDKTFYLDKPLQIPTSTAVPPQTSGATIVYNKPPRPVVMNHRLKFGKKGLSLTFGNATSDTPTNFPYVMVIGYASTISTSAPSNGLVQYSYTANADYTDA